MSVRVCIALLLFAALIICGTANILYIGRLCDDILSETESGSIEKAEKHWLSVVPRLSAFIPHEHLDSISASFARGKSFLKSGSFDEFSAEKESIKIALSVISRYDVPSLRSIF